MATLHDFLIFAAGQIAADSALGTYCRATFGRDLSFFIGEDPERLLKLDDNAPFVTFIYGAPVYEGGGHVIKREVRIGICMTRTLGSNPQNNLVAQTTRIKTLPELEAAETVQQHIMRILFKMPKSTDSTGVIEALNGGVPDAISGECVQSFISMQVAYDSGVFTS